MATQNGPIPNLTPKARFQLSGDSISKHRQMVDSREFERGLDFALLQYQADCCLRENNPTVLGLKIVGAQEFAKTLRLLSEKEEIKLPPPVQTNLVETP